MLIRKIEVDNIDDISHYLWDQVTADRYMFIKTHLDDYGGGDVRTVAVYILDKLHDFKK